MTIRSSLKYSWTIPAPDIYLKSYWHQTPSCAITHTQKHFKIVSVFPVKFTQCSKNSTVKFQMLIQYNDEKKIQFKK